MDLPLEEVRTIARWFSNRGLLRPDIMSQDDPLDGGYLRHLRAVENDMRPLTKKYVIYLEINSEPSDNYCETKIGHYKCLITC